MLTSHDNYISPILTARGCVVDNICDDVVKTTYYVEISIFLFKREGAALLL